MSLAYGEWLERPDHPLLNHLILDKVFQHVRRKDLKECRLVCKKWNVSTIPFTRNAFKVTIIGNKEGETRTCTIENFMEVFRSNRLGIPFSRFRLGSFSTTDGVGQEFVQLCGDMIKEIEFVKGCYMIQDLSALLKSTLKLEVFQIPENLSSRSIVKLFPDEEDAKPRLSCLKELKVCLDDRRSRNRYTCPTFLEELITAAENIRIVRLMDSIGRNEEGQEYNIGSSLDVLSLIEELGPESSIQELELSHERGDDSEYFEVLRKMTLKPNGLKLKRLKYNPIPTFGNPPTTHGLLRLVSLFKDTFEHLELGGKSSACLTEFPKMSNLVRLSVKLPRDFSSKCINLNELFPVLEELGLFEAEYQDGFYEFFPESEPCVKMNTFFSNISINLNGFNQMLTVFPHLTKLSLELGDGGAEILRQIWSHMTHLKYLTISGTLYAVASVDSVLTGISTDALEEIEDAVANLERIPTALERLEAIMRLTSQHVQLPSIRNLTHLRSLVLSITGDGITYDEGGTCLTDLTGYLCIYSMKCLKKLEVKYCEFKKTCCKILTTDMGLQSWTFKTWQRRNIIPSEDDCELNLYSGLIDHSRAHKL